MKLKSTIAMTAIAAALMGVGGAASAAVYTLGIDGSTGGLGTAPFGTVTTSQNGSDTDFVVQLVSRLNFVKTNPFFAFSYNGSMLASDITSITMNGTSGTYSGVAVNSNVGGGFGTMQWGIRWTGTGGGLSGSGLTDPLRFTVRNTLASNFEKLSTSPATTPVFFMADVGCIETADGCTSGTTGRVGNGTVPVPGTIALLGLGMLGLGAARRKLV